MGALYGVEIVRKAYEMTDLGYSSTKVAEATGVSAGTVRYWLKYRDETDVYIDQIAVERALQGERSVWDALTKYERVEFAKRASKALQHRDGGLDMLALQLGVHPPNLRELIKSYDGQEPVLDQSRSTVEGLPKTTRAAQAGKPRPPAIDREKAYKMSQSGMTSREIAAALGAHPASIRNALAARRKSVAA